VKRGTGAPLRVAAVLLLLPAVVASAAPPATRPPARDAAGSTGPDVFVGYSFLHSGEANLNGWEASGTFRFHRFRRSLRLVADLSGHYGSFAGGDLRQINLFGGVRLMGHRVGRFRPFAEALVGGARSTTTFDVLSSSTTALGGALGGGTDYRLRARWALRGQAHLLLLHSNGVWDTSPRLSIGLSYRFKG
jgi:hypothetical protein